MGLASFARGPSIAGQDSSLRAMVEHICRFSSVTTREAEDVTTASVRLYAQLGLSSASASALITAEQKSPCSSRCPRKKSATPTQPSSSDKSQVRDTDSEALSAQKQVRDGPAPNPMDSHHTLNKQFSVFRLHRDTAMKKRMFVIDRRPSNIAIRRGEAGERNFDNAKTSVWMLPKDLRGPTVTIRLVVYAKTCFFGLIQLSHS